MKRIVLKTESLTADQIIRMLEENHILMNDYARLYIAHPRFFSRQSEEVSVVIASLQETGLETGATLNEIFRHIQTIRLKPCSPETGVFLRLQWKEQPQSRNSVLSGTHSAPDSAVTVLSELLEEDDAFPKGLYLRNVDGSLWLRGYICDSTYRFPEDALFAFQESSL